MAKQKKKIEYRIQNIKLVFFFLFVSLYTFETGKTQQKKIEQKRKIKAKKKKKPGIQKLNTKLENCNVLGSRDKAAVYIVK